MHIRDFSIRFNLTLLILTASVLAVVLASVGFAIFDLHSYRDSSVRELTALADTLGANTAASLAFNDQGTAKEMLGALATEPHLQAACLYDNQGRIFAEFRSHGAPPSLLLPTRRSDGAYFDRESLTLFRGVLLNGERTGSIALVFDLREFRSQIIEYAQIAILVILVSVLATFLVSLRLARSIGDPLVQLTAVARRISAAKDYSVRAEIRCGGETGFLVASFNEMLSQIESREGALNAALRSFEESEERYALAARGANDGLWDWNLVTGKIYFSPRWNHMLGYAENEHWTEPEAWFSHIHADDCERVRAEIAAHCENKTPEFVSEYRMRHKSGGYIWTLSRGIAIRDATGKAIRMAGSQTDVTEGKIADPLTGIPNRLYFIDRLESAIETANQHGSHFAVLFIDLDQFKLVNDSLGHAAGDELLIDVAGRLRASIRASSRQGDLVQSVVARIGGDEFAILLGHTQHDFEASIVAARILERLGEPFHLEGRRMAVSASIGIALSSTGCTPEDLLRNADTAMYHAKTNGKARFEYYNDGLREQAVTRFETETGLRKAIEEHQLVVYYQPIVSLQNRRICGFEALVRWNHPERGLVPPDEFIPVAEDSDLIISLGRWVLRDACRQMAEWQNRYTCDPSLTVSVNVSARQLSDPRLVEDVEFALAESGLRHESLALEMTESSIMGDAQRTLATLNHLKKMNIRLEIDDFGTGYSSLSYLQQLPFDVLKIDRSFISDLSAGNSSMDIVKAILQLAHSYKMEVIVEGVETEEQLDCLRQLGCHYLQGFLFSKPVAAEAAEEIYRETCGSGLILLSSSPVALANTV
ncbi:MAG: EAL domain-containing protein [Terracidiphilus sp.]|jgi:diguanylate cyclase (GGDEF)-like protein/PAS domain S-box-containing protein